MGAIEARWARRAAEKGTGRGAALVALLVVAPVVGAQETVEVPARDRPLDVTLEEVYAVGGAMAEADWEIFGALRGPASVAFDGSGNLYVFDRDNFRVVVVGPGGERVREFGQEGEGPGEWRMPLAMTVMRDGTTVITDLGHRAYLVYGPDGELGRTLEMELEGGGFSVGLIQPDPRGGYVYGNAGGAMRVSVRTSAGPAEATPDRVVERISLADGSAETFFTAWQPPPDEGEDRVLRAGGGTFRMAGGGPRAFEPRLFVGVLPDGGLAVVDSTTWTVEVVAPDGSLGRVLRRPSLRPREVTGRVEARERERRLEELESGEGPQMRIVARGPGGAASPISQDQVREMQRSQVERMRFYHEIPVITDLAAGWTGKLWIERAPEEWWEEGPVDVVTPSGDYLGTLPAGRPGVPAAFGPGGLVAYLDRDEFDVPTISVRRLPASLR